mmetsp:Transcript_24083/g.16946  ORF Transcript_24083/g.16946 Transcript_24083/m.16946 type:complete len:202 (-) Transcript_24083:55-660(-)
MQEESIDDSCPYYYKEEEMIEKIKKKDITLAGNSINTTKTNETIIKQKMTNRKINYPKIKSVTPSRNKRIKNLTQSPTHSIELPKRVTISSTKSNRKLASPSQASVRKSLSKQSGRKSPGKKKQATGSQKSEPDVFAKGMEQFLVGLNYYDKIKTKRTSIGADAKKRGEENKKPRVLTARRSPRRWVWRYDINVAEAGPIE